MNQYSIDITITHTWYKKLEIDEYKTKPLKLCGRSVVENRRIIYIVTMCDCIRIYFVFIRTYHIRKQGLLKCIKTYNA